MDEVVGPTGPLDVPRFAGPPTFARLPRLDQVDRCDVAIVGVPFDAGVTYRPGARFGPQAIRQASRLLRVMRRRHGPLALVHFDAQLDTWDAYFGAAFTHGTPFRRAWEEGLLFPERAVHVGIRGPLYSREDLADDLRMGFAVHGSADAPIVGADVVEVSPAYDHAEITSVAASHVVYEVLGLMAGSLPG